MYDILKRHPKISYAIWLIAGFLGLCLPELLNLSWGGGLGTAIWLLSFIRLTCNNRSKGELLLTGAVYCGGYLLKYAGASGIAWFYWVLFLTMGLLQYGIFLLYAWIVDKWNRFATTLVFPLLWMILYLLAMLVRFPTLARMDMLFVDMSALFQAEGLIGSFDFAGALLWIVALLHYALRNRHLGAAALGAALYFTLLLIGIIYLYPNVTCSDAVRVAYTTGPYVGDYINYEELPLETNLESMKSAAKQASDQDAEILVFTEEAFAIKDTEEEAFLEQCRETALTYGIHMLVGLDVGDTDDSADGQSQNKIVWIEPNGEILDTYLKTMLIPLIESGYQSGEGEVPSHTITVGNRQIKISFLICYDSNFARYVGKIDEDTEILFLPSWDWPAVTNLHAKLCRSIAVENRVTVVKPTYDGISVVVDPDGSILYTSSTAESGYENLQVVDIPLRGNGGATYTRNEIPIAARSILTAEILSALVCMILLYGTLFENREKTKRDIVYARIVFTAIIALASDALSWVLDGCERLDSVLLVTTVLSMALTFVMSGQFIAYLAECIKESKRVSTTALKAYMAFAVAAVALTLIGSLNGWLFVYKDGVYYDGPLYWLYLLVNVSSMFFCLAVSVQHRKELSAHDLAAVCLYVAFPGLSALINIFAPDFSFAYPASTLSIITIYVMIQSERVVRLTKEGQISSHYATHDDMTGLLNRRAYDEKLRKLQDIDETVGVIFSDMNLLKYTNDRYGHAAGDNLIIRFAERLCSYFRKEEVYRISGDEFAVILTGIKREMFEQRADTLETSLNAEKLPMACIGIAFGSGRDVDELFKSAELKMYEKKDRFHAEHPEMKLR